MFVSISRYRVKPGMEEALRDHNEEWKNSIRHQALGFISVHVFKSPKDSAEWTSVAMFVDQYSEMANANSTDHKLWYRAHAGAARSATQLLAGRAGSGRVTRRLGTGLPPV